MANSKAATEGGPNHIRRFNKNRGKSPPGRQERRPMGPTIGPATAISNSSSGTVSSFLDRVAQRARALDHAADSELALGHHVIAERLAALADLLREGAP